MEIFERTLVAVPPSAGLLYAAHFCQSEVCNGGFTRLFWNDTGRAATMLGTDYPRSRPDRWKTLESLRDAPGNIDRFRPFEKDFYGLPGTEAGGFEIAADAYASTLA